ncbi:helix-turn-helix domain-containing protein [Micromonospora sp. NPDC092111]|uniref:helix-turn-helix domain-containing protein n=1 Tax=Micromonospora sp. NPDC092111 TaxID=3364289 RepID=UPI003821D9C8
MTIAANSNRTANDRAFLLLDAMATLGPGPHRLRDLAAQAGLEPSTAHRILQSAIRVGTVSKTERGRYLLTSRTGGSDKAAAPEPPSPGPSVQNGTGSMLALSRRTRLLLAALQKTTGQTVLLYVPLMLDTPMRYCLAYFAPRHDELLGDAERQLTSDILFCAPLSVDAPGRVMLAGLADARAGDPAITAIRANGYAFGPSPVAGWQTVTAPLRRYGHLAGAVCVVSPASWMDAHRDDALRELLRITAELAEKIDPL